MLLASNSKAFRLFEIWRLTYVDNNNQSVKEFRKISLDFFIKNILSHCNYTPSFSRADMALSGRLERELIEHQRKR